MPLTVGVKIERVCIRVIHEVAHLSLDEHVRVAVYGHSHRPLIREEHGVLYVNPGSAGPRRFTLPVAVGELKISGASVRARIRELI